VSLTPDQSAAVATINGMHFPLRDPHWPYPTREPYRCCCSTPAAGNHATTCTHFRPQFEDPMDHPIFPSDKLSTTYQLDTRDDEVAL